MRNPIKTFTDVLADRGLYNMTSKLAKMFKVSTDIKPSLRDKQGLALIKGKISAVQVVEDSGGDSIKVVCSQHSPGIYTIHRDAFTEGREAQNFSTLEMYPVPEEEVKEEKKEWEDINVLIESARLMASQGQVITQGQYQNLLSRYGDRDPYPLTLELVAAGISVMSERKGQEDIPYGDDYIKKFVIQTVQEGYNEEDSILVIMDRFGISRETAEKAYAEAVYGGVVEGKISQQDSTPSLYDEPGEGGVIKEVEYVERDNKWLGKYTKELEKSFNSEEEANQWLEKMSKRKGQAPRPSGTNQIGDEVFTPDGDRGIVVAVEPSFNPYYKTNRRYDKVTVRTQGKGDVDYTGGDLSLISLGGKKFQAKLKPGDPIMDADMLSSTYGQVGEVTVIEDGKITIMMEDGTSKIVPEEDMEKGLIVKQSQSLDQDILEFEKLSNEIKAAKIQFDNLMSPLKEKKDDLMDRIRPQMEQMENQTVETDKFIARYKKWSQKKAVSYKALFEAALKKVNGQIKKMMLDLQASMTSYDTREKLEVIMKGSAIRNAQVMEILRGWWQSFKDTLSGIWEGMVRTMEVGNRDLEDICDQAEGSPDVLKVSSFSGDTITLPFVMDIEAEEDKRTIEELQKISMRDFLSQQSKGDWLSPENVAKLCPDCARYMRAQNIEKISKSYLEEKMGINIDRILKGQFQYDKLVEIAKGLYEKFKHGGVTNAVIEKALSGAGLSVTPDMVSQVTTLTRNLLQYVGKKIAYRFDVPDRVLYLDIPGKPPLPGTIIESDFDPVDSMVPMYKVKLDETGEVVRTSEHFLKPKYELGIGAEMTVSMRNL